MKTYSIRLIILLLLAPFYMGQAAPADEQLSSLIISTDPGDEEEIQWGNLPTGVKTYLVEHLKVKENDVLKAYKIGAAVYRLKLQSKRNTYVIATDLKVRNLGVFDVHKTVKKAQPTTRGNLINQKKTVKRIQPLGKEVEFKDVPENVQQYLLKRMQSSPQSIYRITKERGSEYQVILKKEYDEILYKHDRHNITLIK